VNLSRAYLQEGETKIALSILEEGLIWPRPRGQGDVNFLLNTAILRKQLGDKAGHDALVNDAVRRAKAYGMTKQAAQK